MTFRDDHDAALARADALEDEVERTKRERDALAAKVRELEAAKAAPKPTPKPVEPEREPEPDDKPRRGERKLGGYIFGAVGVLLIGGLVAFTVGKNCNYSRDRDAWEAKVAERRAYQERWERLVSVEPCLRQVAGDAVMARRNTPDKADPRRTYVWSFADRLGGNCLYGIDKLVADPKTQAPMRTALAAWLDVQRQLGAAGKPLHAYYSNGDWKEDGFRGAQALWAPVLTLLERQVAVIATVRRDAFVEIRTEVRAMQRAHEASGGRDEIWWRVELGVQLWEINDRVYEAAGIYAGRESDDKAGAAAVREPVIALLEATKQAPIEVRRIIRKLDWITNQIASGQPLRGETPLWHLASDGDRDLIGIAQRVIPGMPPDPGPAPESPRGD